MVYKKQIYNVEELNDWLSQIYSLSDEDYIEYKLKVIEKDNWYFLYNDFTELDFHATLIRISTDMNDIIDKAYEKAIENGSYLLESEEEKKRYKEKIQQVGRIAWSNHIECTPGEDKFRKDIILNSADSINQWLKEAGLGNYIRVQKAEKYWTFEESIWNNGFILQRFENTLFHCVKHITDLLGLDVKNYNIQDNYTWEITNIDDANDWIENIGLDEIFSIKEINNVYHLYRNDVDGRIDALSRDLDILLSELSQEARQEKVCPYVFKMDKPKQLQSNIIVKDLESANQWIADIGYGGAIRFDYDGSLWSVQIFEEDWYTEKTVNNFNLALEEVLTLILPDQEMPKIALEKETKVIRSVKDANDWLKSIGKDENYKFQYSKVDKGTVIQCMKNNQVMCSSKEIEKAVGMIVGDIKEAMPLCKNTIFDITTLNMWLDTIDYKAYTSRRPYLFKKQTETNNVYSIWDIYKNGDTKETDLKFVSTSLYMSLRYLVNERDYLKDCLWDVQLKKTGKQAGKNIIISNLDIANQWLAFLGYRTTIRFNCKTVEKDTPTGKIKFDAYFLQERLSGENWKIINKKYGTFEDILSLFCKLANITEVPESTIRFTTEVKEEKKVPEAQTQSISIKQDIPKTQNLSIAQDNSEIQSVKGANIWFDKINIQGCKFRMKSREDKQVKRIYTIEFQNSQGQIGTFYECASLKQSIEYFCQFYKIKIPRVANM